MTPASGVLVVGWEHVFVVVLAFVLVGGAVLMMVRGADGTPGTPFTPSRHDYNNLQQKVASIEQQLSGVPRRQEMMGLGERVGGLERGVTGLQHDMRGVRESNARVERAVEMITQSLLQEGKTT